MWKLRTNFTEMCELKPERSVKIFDKFRPRKNMFPRNCNSLWTQLSTHDTKLITRHKHESSCTSRFRCFNLFHARNCAHRRNYDQTNTHHFYYCLAILVFCVVSLYTYIYIQISRERHQNTELSTTKSTCIVFFLSNHTETCLSHRFIYFHLLSSSLSFTHAWFERCHHKAGALMNHYCIETQREWFEEKKVFNNRVFIFSS